MEGKDIFEESTSFRAFPAPEEVFANRVQEHAEYLLPIGLLAADQVSPDWEG